MASGTKIRTLSRLLDSSGVPLWVISADGRLVYLSAATSEWLGIDVQTLIDRRSVAGASISSDPLDFLAASLSPPPGFSQQGTASLCVQPPPIDGRKIKPLDVRFVRMGDPDAPSAPAAIMAIGGTFQDSKRDGEIQESVALRSQLDEWRQRHSMIATIATAGVSSSARRLRARLQVACSIRTHVGLFGPQGSGGASIANRIHHCSAPDEALMVVDGPLMDAELLDATLIPAINQLAESKTSTATALVRDLDQTPIEAQQRLAEILSTFSGRLRLIALCSSMPTLLREPLVDSNEADAGFGDELALTENDSVGVHPQLVEVLSEVNLVIAPLSSRVDDIPILATAILDVRHAAGEGAAERFSRAALDALVIYPWPGNYEELDSAVRHAIKTAPHESIGVEHLPLAVRSFRPGENPVSARIANVTLDDAVRRYEMRIINDVLADTDGNRAEAARRLGMSRARLLRKLEDS